MWTLDDIQIEIVDAERDIIEVEIITPAGQLQLMGVISLSGGVLRLRGAHVQGLSGGALGRSGLNTIGRKFLVEADVDEIIIEGSPRTTGRNPGRVPKPIRFRR